MSEEMLEIFDGMRQSRQEQHAEWHRMNMAVFANSTVRFRLENRGESCLFREHGKPKVDFFPSTGRWRSRGVTFSGGAEKFLKWYEKQI